MRCGRGRWQVDAGGQVVRSAYSRRQVTGDARQAADLLSYDQFANLQYALVIITFIHSSTQQQCQSFSSKKLGVVWHISIR